MQLDSIEQSLIYNYTLYKLVQEKMIPLERVKAKPDVFFDLALAVETNARHGMVFAIAFDEAWCSFAGKFNQI